MSGEYTWPYGIGANEKILTGLKKRLIINFVVICLVATTAVTGAAFFVTRGIDPSLDMIVESCKEIESGNFRTPPLQDMVKIREFRLIASAMDKMVQSIAEREHIITQNVTAIQSINNELETKNSIIRSERQRLIIILETIDDGIITTDSQGIVTYFNRASEIITGIDRHVVIGRHYSRFVPGVTLPNSRQILDRELTTAGSIETQSLKIFVTPYEYETGARGHVLLVRDVSKEKKMEEFKADFISSITHDIKSLLVPVRGFLGRILQDRYGAVTGPLRERLTTIRESSEKIYELVENYLNISRIESGRLELSLAPVDIVEIIGDVVRLFGPRVSFHEDRNGLPLAFADKAYIERVLINLIMNALKFSKEESDVIVEASSEGVQLIVSVKDDGVGIPPDEIGFLFERYRRGSFGKKEDGSGLGLFISKSIVRAHGGDIRAESVVGKGSVFTFSLPVYTGEP